MYFRLNDTCAFCNVNNKVSFHCPDISIISLFQHSGFILNCPLITFLISDSYLSYVVLLSILEYIDSGTSVVISICNLIVYLNLRRHAIDLQKISLCYVLFLPLLFWFVWKEKQMIWIKLTTCLFTCGTSLKSGLRWPLVFLPCSVVA